MTLADRIANLKQIMAERDWDLIVCARPMNVLMLSGYWPLIGTGMALIDREGRIQLLVPKDEQELAHRRWADRVCVFAPVSLADLNSVAQSVEQPLRELPGCAPLRIVCEWGEASEPSSYVAMHLYGSTLADLLRNSFPRAQIESADEVLATLRARKTDAEMERIRRACRTAGHAFEAGAKQLCSGSTEKQAALHFQTALYRSTAERSGGSVSCMSGANSGHAYGAFARSTHKRIENGDPVLTHCNSYEDGYWTDITRTYATGGETSRHRAMSEAIFAARAAALKAIGAGVLASEVDAAARLTLRCMGFGAQFRHATGHGVGFGAIDAHALPRIHPKSSDRLEPGMVFNIEPGIYFPEYGGMRHCDVVALTDSGVEVLTPFQVPREGLVQNR